MAAPDVPRLTDQARHNLTDPKTAASERVHGTLDAFNFGFADAKRV